MSTLLSGRGKTERAEAVLAELLFTDDAHLTTDFVIK